MQTIERTRIACNAAFSLLNEWLSGRDYVAGNDMTTGDIPVGCAVNRWRALPLERPSMPPLERYYERLLQRAAFVDHVAAIPVT
jgi:glutathione S-transferase